METKTITWHYLSEKKPTNFAFCLVNFKGGSGFDLCRWNERENGFHVEETESERGHFHYDDSTRWCEDFI